MHGELEIGRSARTQPVERFFRGRRLSANWNAAAPLALPLATGLVFFALWQAAVMIAELPAAILPTPIAVIESLFMNAPALARNALHTGVEVLGGFALAAATGIGIAFTITISRTMREMLYPTLVAIQVIPKIALAPVFIVWFGIGFESRLVFATFISFFPVVIATSVGLLHADPSALRLCRALRANRLQTFIHVRFPYALPYLFSGLKIAATMAMIGVIVGEFISARMGLGYLILSAASKMDTALMLASIVVLCLEGLAVFGLVVLAERFVRRRIWP